MEKRISDALRLSIKHFKQRIVTKLLRTTTQIQRFPFFFFFYNQTSFNKPDYITLIIA